MQKESDWEGVEWKERERERIRELVGERKIETRKESCFFPNLD